MAHTSLTGAKKAKKDEFYTRYRDIEKEISAYLDFDKEIFKDKTVLLPCDDPEWSNFTKYFAQNFENFGLKKLISTSFALNSKKFKENYQLSLLEQSHQNFDKLKTDLKGKIFILSKDNNDDGKIDIDDLEWSYLEGDGDFLSDEVSKLKDESDVIVTNPPFSKFKEFFSWIDSNKKSFLIIANKNAVTYKDIFPLIMNNKIWTGKTSWSGGLWFETRDKDDVDKVIDGIDMKNVPAMWITNIEHGRRHEPIPLMSMDDNIKFSSHKCVRGKKYNKYSSYDAIEIPRTMAIPSDYNGVMGVPISFLDKYCPEQFEILGTSDNGLIDDKYKLTQGLSKEFVEDYYSAGGKSSVKEGNVNAGFYKDGVATIPFSRIFIRHIRNNLNEN